MTRRGQPERELVAAIGRIGVWDAGLNSAPAEEVRAVAREIEQLGYRAVWLPEGVKDVFVNTSLMLAAADRLIVVSAIANVWIRSPYAMATAARTVGEAFPGRFVLGLGIGHHGQERFGGERFERPLTQMREYLDVMDEAPYYGPIPTKPVQRVLAALGPRMLAMAAERSRGAHTYLVPVEHTAFARQLIGPEPVLAVEQSFVLGRPESEAREIARGHVARYLRLPNYVNNLQRLGFSERDVADEGSDHLIDAIVALGDAERIADRIRAHLDAGADHVCVQPLMADSDPGALRALEALARALG